MFTDEITGAHADTGCRYSKRCLECPYKDCIITLKWHRQQLILNEPLLRRIYAVYDSGVTKVKLIKAWFKELQNTPTDTIYDWIQRRNQIEDVLNRYGLAENIPL